MKIENQVCTVEQAAQLASLGVTQCSLFYHSINSYDQNVRKITMHPDSRDIVFSAFTTGELGIMLPPGDFSFFDDNTDNVATNKPEQLVQERPFWWASHLDEKSGKTQSHEFGGTEAEARADLLIMLLKTGKIQSLQVNSSLVNA